MSRRRLRAVVASLVGAAAAAGVWLTGVSPASAAGCTGATGVTVVVDFAELGGGLTAGCDPSAEGQRARAILVDAGYSVAMATKSPGFLCRVNGLPADDPCVDAAPADRYWSVWWADGQGGSWVYSARGVDSLRVPEGGYLALAWHQGSGRSQPPATAPVSRAAAEKPTKASKPRAKATKAAEPRRTKAAAPRTAAPKAASTPATSAAATPSATGSTSPSASASPSEDLTPTDVPSPGESVTVAPGLPAADEISSGPDDVQVDAASADDGGLPTWVPVLVVVAVLVLGGAVALRRRQG